MAEIIPAVLAYSFKELEETLRSLSGLTSFIHIDATDGHFGGKPSWPYSEHGESDLETAAEKLKALPFWDEMKFEMHLMVFSPEKTAPMWVRAGASRVIVHLEAIQDYASLENELFGKVEAGIALNLETRVQAMERLDGKFDFVQCMAIREIGVQGQPFESSVLEKIRRVKQARPMKQISVDGGVNLDNAAALIEAGADRLVVGSAIVRRENIAEAIKNFQNL